MNTSSKFFLYLAAADVIESVEAALFFQPLNFFTTNIDLETETHTQEPVFSEFL